MRYVRDTVAPRQRWYLSYLRIARVSSKHYLTNCFLCKNVSAKDFQRHLANAGVSCREEMLNSVIDSHPRENRK